MPLSAKDIDALQLSTSLRGYDTDEVDDLLDRIAAQIHRTERELGDLHRRVRELEANLHTAYDTEQELRAQIVVTQTRAEAAETDAARQADEVRRLSQREAQIRTEAAEEIRQHTTQVRDHAARRIADAEAHAANVQRTVDQQLDAVRDELEQRIASLYRDTESRVADAWETVDRERALLAQERGQVADELQALRELAAALRTDRPLLDALSDAQGIDDLGGPSAPIHTLAVSPATANESDEEGLVAASDAADPASTASVQDAHSRSRHFEDHDDELEVPMWPGDRLADGSSGDTDHDFDPVSAPDNDSRDSDAFAGADAPRNHAELQSDVEVTDQSSDIDHTPDAANEPSTDDEVEESVRDVSGDGHEVVENGADTLPDGAQERRVAGMRVRIYPD